MSKLIKVAGCSGKPRGHVVFVHGLGGHAYKTWTNDDNIDGFWPLWLARDLDGAAIWTLSYDAPITNWLGTAPPLQVRAVNVLDELLSTPELSAAPIAFVCHSLGGLVVKQMMRAANDRREREREDEADAEAEALLEQVKVVIFIATPHSGSDHASWLGWLRLIAWPSMAAQDMVRNSSNLRNLNQWYCDWSNQISHKIYFELHSTAAGKIVDAGSAAAGLQSVGPVGIDKDHVEICKPTNKNDQPYKSIRHFLVKKVFARAKGRKHPADVVEPELPEISTTRSIRWAPMVARLAMLAVIVVIVTTSALYFLRDPLAEATVQEIQQAMLLRHPELTPEQIERFIDALRAARGDPTFEKAVAEARKGKTLVAEGIWKQIYEDRNKQRNKASKQQAKAARYLAAAAVVGNVAEGLRWYRDATTLDPSNMEGWLELGDAARSAGTVVEADQAYRTYISLAKKTGDEREESVGLNGLGNVQVVQGDRSGAMKSYQASYAIRKRLVESDENNAGYQRDLSVSVEKIGDIFKSENNLTAALKWYRDSLAIRKHLADSDTNNAGWQRDLSVSYKKIGDVLKDRDPPDLTGALKHYRDSFMIFERLAKIDKKNTGYQRDLSVSHNTIGDFLQAHGTRPEALKHYQTSLAIRKQLIKLDENHVGWQYDLGISYERIGNIQTANGDFDAALTNYNARHIIIRKLASSDEKNAAWQRDLAFSHWHLAQLGDKKRFHWQKVVNILKKLDAEGRLALTDQKWLPIAERNLEAAAQ